MFRTASDRFLPTIGITASLVVLIMSVAGLTLACESPRLDQGSGRAWSAPPSTVVNRLSPETLPAPERTMRPVAAPAMHTPMADAEEPSAVLFELAGATTLLRSAHALDAAQTSLALYGRGFAAAGGRRLRAAVGPPSSRAA
ncbi:MAG: hypothetical protein IT178_11050 [Acidobacteria bacterium]|nr:hypothetical protein [Acidobacteriota bacterium]